MGGGEGGGVGWGVLLLKYKFVLSRNPILTFELSRKIVF